MVVEMAEGFLFVKFFVHEHYFATFVGGAENDRRVPEERVDGMVFSGSEI